MSDDSDHEAHKNDNHQNQRSKHGERDQSNIAEFEQAISPSEAEQRNEILDQLNIDNVQNIDRRINLILQSAYNLEDDMIDLFINVMIERIVRTGADFFVHMIHNFTYPMLLQHIGGLALNGGCHVQIIGDSQSFHWRCYYYDGKHLKIYDSLPNPEAPTFSEREKRYIAIRYPHVALRDIEFPPVTRQLFGSNTCGIYAAAFATTLILGGDSTLISYSRNEDLMRYHFHQVLETGVLRAFPQVRETLILPM